MCSRCGPGLTFFGLAAPQAPMLDSYAEALRTGWSPNNTRDVSAEQLADIAADPAGFLARLSDPAGTVALPDGTIVPRLPFIVRWMWDGDFCGVISLRHQTGTPELPPHVSGHIGFAVVPWKRRHGYASRALQQILSEAKEAGLPRVEITADPGNIGSRTVIERNGGVLAGTWSHPAFAAAGILDRFTIDLSATRAKRLDA